MECPQLRRGNYKFGVNVCEERGRKYKGIREKEYNKGMGKKCMNFSQGTRKKLRAKTYKAE